MYKVQKKETKEKPLKLEIEDERVETRLARKGLIKEIRTKLLNIYIIGGIFQTPSYLYLMN